MSGDFRALRAPESDFLVKFEGNKRRPADVGVCGRCGDKVDPGQLCRAAIVVRDNPPADPILASNADHRARRRWILLTLMRGFPGYRLF
jgi:hypothetical protein